MLVTFRCDAHGDVIMFGDVAVRLIKLMGHSGTVPSAILAKDVPAALARLKSAVVEAGNEPTGETDQDTNDDQNDDVVSLANRASPLIGLLAAAASAKCDVMWNK